MKPTIKTSNDDANPAMIKNQIENISRRTREYWLEDGLGEIVGAAVFLLIGLFSLLEGMTEPGFWRCVTGIAAMLAIGAGPWLARPVIKKLKNRLTYPRTGYVAYRMPSKQKRLLSMIIAAFVTLVVVALLMQRPEVSLAWIPLIEGIAVGGYLYYVGYKHNLLRFQVQAVIALSLGATLSFAGVGDLIGVGLFFLIMGMVVLAAGSMTLRKYLQSSPTPQEHDYAG